MIGPRIDLDHLTTTPLHPEVQEAMRPYLDHEFGSPASFHQGGLRARDALAQARGEVAALIGADSPDSILFTSGATEAANLAIKGAAWASHRRGNHLVLTGIEHPAIDRSVGFLEGRGFVATRIPVGRHGFIDPESIRSALRPETFLVCVHHAQHDLGSLQPLAEIATAVDAHGALLFVDASASAGWAALNVQALPISLLSLAPHRFYGPKGVGILYRHQRARITSLIHGGNQEHGLRAGTENMPAIVGAGMAATVAQREMELRRTHVGRLQEILLKQLSVAVPLTRLNGPPPGPHRLPHHLNLSFEFLEGEGLTLVLDLQGVAIHSGPACLAGSQKIPPALAAIGLSPALARASVLLSPGASTTTEAIDLAVRKIAAAAVRLRDMSPLWEAYRAGRIESAITGRVFSP
jgi:cysteine desulfurase